MNPVRLCIVVTAAALAGCAGMSPEEAAAEAERMSTMTCDDLEIELYRATRKSEVEVIRRLQADKDCEIRPLLAGPTKQKRRYSNYENRSFKTPVGGGAPRSTRPAGGGP